MHFESPSHAEEPGPAHPGWNFQVLTVALLLASLWHGFWSLVRCRCFEADWHTAQAHAGLIFCGLVLLRMILAKVRAEQGRGWLGYALLCLLSPLWIRGVFALVLVIRDAFGS